MITPGHEVKVMDLGIATFADDPSLVGDGGFSGVAEICLARAPPARGRGESMVGPTSSLGVILYEAGLGVRTPTRERTSSPC